MPEAGYLTRVLYDEHDLSSVLRSASTDITIEMLDVTTFDPSGNPDMSYIAGLKTGTVTLDGLWEDLPTDGVDELFNTDLDGGLSTVTISYEGLNAVGDRVTLVSGRQTDSPITSSVADVVQLSSGRQGSGAVKGGVALHEQTQETTTGNFASVDNTALSSNGAVAHLHVTDFTGTSATIVVADSTNDTVFSDLITFTSVTGATSERASVTGTVNRYARVELSGTFTDITFSVGFARL